MIDRDRARLGMTLAAVGIGLWLAWLARAALPPFLLAAFFAYLLSPLVDRLARLIDRGRPHRSSVRAGAVLIVYGVVAMVLTGLGFLVVPLGVESVRTLVEERESIAEGVRANVQSWLAIYEARVPDEIQRRIEEWLEGASGSIGDRVTAALSRSFSLVFASVSAALGFFIVPIWLFLILKDQQKVSTWFYGLFPRSIRRDVRFLVGDGARVLGAYLRVLGVLVLVIGLVTYIGLTLLGVPFAPALAIVAGLAELVPIIGPIAAAVTAALVVLAIEPGFKVLWVLLFFIGVQQLENYVLVPRLQGRAMDVHPAIVMMLIIGMGELAGILGMVVVIPLYAVLRNSFVYIYHRLEGRLPQRRK